MKKEKSLKKKIKQIDRLEESGKELNDEEKAKIFRKIDLIQQLEKLQIS